ncbi:MAG: LSU ribosomal protein L15P [Candidatus Electronema aureum]|uniref:Large ribosomal subunit protein uL15 n=1 Tax=Candidatus Electronema aureum TaxID=2005002 RepID=A0A521G4Y0_9BACT|nr:MAG: LSU ribosomal protein L15P [Candidatus Electronema aureum]
MLKLNNLSPTEGSRRQKKRIGRGQGTGHGKTAGKGHKGAKARTGYSMKAGFEGGQMPLHRRLPKVGFTNKFKKEYLIVTLSDLDRFAAGAVVNRDALLAAGLLSDKDSRLIKVLANGEISRSVTVEADKVSQGAREKILAAGGSVKE